MTKEQLIAKIEAAYERAAGRNNTGDMLTATHQLLEIWLQEAGRYAQVPAAATVGTSTLYSAPLPTPTWNDYCACGANESCQCNTPRPPDETRAKAPAATLDPRDEAAGDQRLTGFE